MAPLRLREQKDGSLPSISMTRLTLLVSDHSIGHMGATPGDVVRRTLTAGLQGGGSHELLHAAAPARL